MTHTKESMDVLETILSRRSIRSYQRKEVSLELIKELLKAAMYAPSAADEQPWHFLVLTDPTLLEKIPTLHPYAAMVGQAPVAVVVCGEPSTEKHAGMWVQDCAAATENLLLAAHAKGLGSVWVGVYPREERMAPLRKLLGIPANVQPFAILPLGYPAEYLEPKEDHYREERIRWNRW
jgi:nitroreductase